MSLIEKLSEKIDLLLDKTNNQELEIQDLRLKISTLIAQSEEKDRQISTLYEEIANKDKSVQSLYDKIQEVLDK
ncbi:DUF904 domain-containing protein [Helicobacter cappadocius]|uniref:DUF904 domain-containing protein n=1 Tax=Helicobacter cappadocius TaxID=3063998 RepID=A0AA90PWV0_9HELI|nr:MULTISPECIES: DUF904 domain-containing protein [unclassified Helicobacter]MDO7253722.1 DUF904 domain-containing protein [Helicobacter sp. faydin-H75]MDP2539650.1 DUF904 domain-containing protein [Helicobacter sp. faydin-H76]